MEEKYLKKSLSNLDRFRPSGEEREEIIKKLHRRVKIENYVVGTLLVAGLIGLPLSRFLEYNKKLQPVESGFAKPSKLELKIEDANDNGRNEYFLQYDGKRYDIKLNEQGEPILMPYTKPGE
jgi:hypothetical protein